MSASISARRISLQSMAIAPLVTAALLVGTVGTSPAPTASAPGAPAASAASALPARASVNLAAKPVAYVTPASIAIPRGLKAVRIAAAQKGKPYRWGGAGPSSFDCSGLVYYVYKKRLHVSLPRTANAQRLKTIRIAKASLRPGDLVFFMSGGRAYHVGIYAGHGKIWHSPRPGQRVQLSKLWTSRWVAGRVR